MCQTTQVLSCLAIILIIFSPALQPHPNTNLPGHGDKYLTIIPRSGMSSKSIAAEGRIGYRLRGNEGERNNRPLSRGGHFVSGDLKSFVYARLAS